MSDDEGSAAPGTETRGQMLQRHKREVVELKKGKAGRGLGKKELAQKETDLKAKHDSELEALEKGSKTKQKEAPSEIVEPPSEKAEEEADQEPSTSPSNQSLAKQPSRAQKRKAAKQKANQDKQAQIEADIAISGPDKRAIEQEQMVNKLLELNKIRPDGNCLFAAVVDQLNLIGRGDEYSTGTLRVKVSDFISDHSDDYLPFCAEDEETFKEYCDTMKNTSAWGGEVELQALSRLVKVKIHVYHADSETVIVGENFPTEIYLSYHKHEFTLGEHYNSVGPLSQ